MGTVILVIVILLLYFLPSLIAWIRKHPQLLPIFVLNLFLGWTYLGWVGSLVWATLRFRTPESVEYAAGTAGAEGQGGKRLSPKGPALD